MQVAAALVLCLLGPIAGVAAYFAGVTLFERDFGHWGVILIGGGIASIWWIAVLANSLLPATRAQVGVRFRGGALLASIVQIAACTLFFALGAIFGYGAFSES